ncbi:MAG TPA: signal peptidase II [Dehalococcoidia bacterium]|nr:signal peptidase II [Dehalococcoidia bacterium]
MEETVIRAPSLRERLAASRSERGHLVPYLFIVLAVIVADQLTKALVRGRLSEGEAWPSKDALLAISHVENSGAAFGIFQGGGAFLLGAAAVGVAAIIVYMLLAPPAQRLYVAALSLILGGAIGNLTDRLAKGTVTDFIDPTHYPAFNIADSAIVCGVIAVVLLSLREEARR